MILHHRPHIGINKTIKELIVHGYPVQPEKWQGIKVENDNRYRMVDCFNVDLDVSMAYPVSAEPLTYWAHEIRPNLPWADNHFLERIGGIALNPGVQYQNWPFYKRDAEMRSEGGKFSHSYMERYWPKHAGHNIRMNDIEVPPGKIREGFSFKTNPEITPNFGIRYPYGDLEDVVNLLSREPNTRQAYLPVWFPEDTGVLHGGRVPCTLGYWFRQRFDYLHIVYYIRSCDALRHFRDDVYMTIRLAHWVLEMLKVLNPEKWQNVGLGALSMKIGSLHCFASDLPTLRGQVEG